ncbi:MAG: hypothetical protein LJF06_09160 [Gemmatimonadetes bacterium]|nr:hypothetical protein [Gemmatimonadota bacterium]
MSSYCFFCDEPLAAFDPGDPSGEVRLAFDPHLGRLWQVCPRCTRWNPVPLEERWETLEACERLATRRGRILVEGEHLTLLAAGGTQLIRVGEALRLEFSDWRYSRRLDPHLPGGPGLLTRMILDLPESPAGGVTFHGVPRFPDLAWIVSPFQEHARLLTALLLHAPLADACPSCGAPLAVEPAAFGGVRLIREGAGPRLVATCAFCGVASAVPLREGRAVLRAALAVVGRSHRDPEEIAGAATLLDGAGGAEPFIDELGRSELTLDVMDTDERIALAIGLDEEAETEALEAEWREAEELAAIMDDELTEVPGFEEFRARVLEGGQSFPDDADASPGTRP